MELPTKFNPLLELEVRVININEGRNLEIQNRCKYLWEYSAFISKVRSFWEEFGDLEEGIKVAVNYCQKNDILKQFLEKHGSEVLNMLLTEWNTEDAIAFAREEGREDERKFVLSLFEQGLSVEEVKQRLAEEGQITSNS